MINQTSINTYGQLLAMSYNHRKWVEERAINDAYATLQTHCGGQYMCQTFVVVFLLWIFMVGLEDINCF